MAGTGQLCGVQNPCRSQCTCIKFCWYSNCLLRRGRIYWEFIILLYIEFYARKLNSARILHAAELSPSSSGFSSTHSTKRRPQSFPAIIPIWPFFCDFSANPKSTTNLWKRAAALSSHSPRSAGWALSSSSWLWFIANPGSYGDIRTSIPTIASHQDYFASSSRDVEAWTTYTRVHVFYATTFWQPRWWWCGWCHPSSPAFLLNPHTLSAVTHTPHTVRVSQPFNFKDF